MVSDKVVSFKSTPMWEDRLANSVEVSSTKDSSSSGVTFTVCVAIEVEEVVDVCVVFSRTKLLPPITFLFEAIASRRQRQF